MALVCGSERDNADASPSESATLVEADAPLPAESREEVTPGSYQLVANVGVVALEVQAVHELHHRLVDRRVRTLLRVHVRESLEEVFDERFVLHLDAQRHGLRLEVAEVAETDAATPG